MFNGVVLQKHPITKHQLPKPRMGYGLHVSSQMNGPKIGANCFTDYEICFSMFTDLSLIQSVFFMVVNARLSRNYLTS